MGAIIGLTADHGMNAKHDDDGKPNVIYLQDLLDNWVGEGSSRVILPITDPYVVHHGALGSYATIYLEGDVDRGGLIERLQTLPGVEAVFGNEEGCTQFGLANDRMGDIIVVSTRHTVIGTSADRHDLSGLDVPLRSHGGISEQTVPLIFNGPVDGMEGRSRLRNFDVFDIAAQPRYPELIRTSPMNVSDSSIRHEKMRIAGRKVDGETGKVIEVFNPYNNQVVGTVPRASRAQVVAAFDIAAAFKPTLSRYERQQILMRTGEMLVARKEEISDLITAESGLSKKDSLYEVGRAYDVFTLAGQLCIHDDGRIFSCDLTPTARSERYSRNASR